MASSIMFGGLASGMDTASIIDNLVQLQSAPIAALQKRQGGVRSQISIVGDIASKLSALDSAARALASDGVLGLKASSGTTAFTASAGSGASPGTFRVQVTQLAQAAKGHSTAFAAGETVQGGTISFTVQDQPYSVTIDPDSTLATAAEKLRATGAPISVAILDTDEGRVLSVGSIATGSPLSGPGVALALTHEASGAGTRPLGFAIPAGQEAKNATFTVDGLAFTRTSNAVTDAVPGTLLTLTQQGGPPESLVVETDLDATRSKLQTFVDAYNAVMKIVQRESKPTAATDRATTLTGDSAVRMLSGQLQAIISSKFRETGATRTLADLGVTTDRATGLVSLDTKVLNAAVARDPAAANALFAAAQTGVAAITSKLVKGFTNAIDGVLTGRTTALQRLSSRLDDDIARLQARLDAYRANLVKQYAAMEDAVSKLKASGSFLTSQEALNTKKS